VPDRQTPPRPGQIAERRRYFNDPDGVHWEVREMKNPDYDRRGGYCLIFESINIVRRVRRYPADWYEMSAEELQDLGSRP
jgi:hypothetical protein